MFQKFLRSEKAVSSVVGMVLIIGLTITSIGIILIYSVPAIDGIENTVKVKNMEQSFSALDARMSEVTLGEAQSQVVDIPLMRGSLNINNPGTSDIESKLAIVIISTDADIYEKYMDSGLVWGAWDEYHENEIDFIISEMGSIEYTRGGHKVAYEGGGVWSQYPNGRSIMVSPPEFHYNGETLTLPIMNITGSGSISGNGDAGLSLTSDNAPDQLFPNNDSSNPLDADKILIYIKSEYYDAWASYANSQTYSSAVMDHENKTAVIELDVIPPMGRNSLSNFFKVGAVDDTVISPIHSFKLDFYGAGPSPSKGNPQSGLRTLNDNMTASSGSRSLEYHFHGKGNEVTLEVTYEDSDISDKSEVWEIKKAFPLEDSDMDGYEHSEIDLLSKEIYLSFKSDEFYSNLTATNSTIKGPVDYESLYNITQHYMKLITEEGSVVFELSGKESSPVCFSHSMIDINYDTRPGSMIYLHVTENKVNVELT